MSQTNAPQGKESDLCKKLISDYTSKIRKWNGRVCQLHEEVFGVPLKLVKEAVYQGNNEFLLVFYGALLWGDLVITNKRKSVIKPISPSQIERIKELGEEMKKLGLESISTEDYPQLDGESKNKVLCERTEQYSRVLYTEYYHKLSCAAGLEKDEFGDEKDKK